MKEVNCYIVRVFWLDDDPDIFHKVFIDSDTATMEYNTQELKYSNNPNIGVEIITSKLVL
jgi:hypothetical protein